MSQDSGHHLARSSASGFCKTEMMVSARAVVLSEAELEKDLPPTSCDCW